MSHYTNIQVFDYGTNQKQIETNKVRIQKELDSFAEVNSDVHSHLPNRIDFNSNKVFDDYESACEYLGSHDGFYWQGGVLFKSYDDMKSSKVDKLQKKEEDVRKKRIELQTDLDAYVHKNHSRNRKSTFVGCPNCKSKLHKDYLKLLNYSLPCPLCKTNLFNNTVQARVSKFRKDILSLLKEEQSVQKELETEKRKNYKLKWAVKYEFHC